MSKLQTYILRGGVHVVNAPGNWDSDANGERSALIVDADRFAKSLRGLIDRTDAGILAPMVKAVVPLGAERDYAIRIFVSGIPDEDAEGARKMLQGMARPYAVEVLQDDPEVYGEPMMPGQKAAASGEAVA